MHQCSNIIGCYNLAFFTKITRQIITTCMGSMLGLSVALMLRSYFRYHRARYLSLLCTYDYCFTEYSRIFIDSYFDFTHTKVQTSYWLWSYALSISAVPYESKTVNYSIVVVFSRLLEKSYFVKTRKKCWVNKTSIEATNEDNVTLASSSYKELKKRPKVTSKFDSGADSSYHPELLFGRNIAVTLKTPHAVDYCKAS